MQSPTLQASCLVTSWSGTTTRKVKGCLPMPPKRRSKIATDSIPKTIALCLSIAVGLDTGGSSSQARSSQEFAGDSAPTFCVAGPVSPTHQNPNLADASRPHRTSRVSISDTIMATNNEYQPTVLRSKPAPPRERMYAIGKSRGDQEFGMTHGPTPDETAMLETVGEDDSCLLRINPNGTAQVLWRWCKDRWVHEP